MARVKYISSRPSKPLKPIATKSRPGHELIRDSHTGSYVEVPIKPLSDCTVKLPDYCHVKQPELVRPQTFPHGLPTPPPEGQPSNPRKRRCSSSLDTEIFCLPPPALDMNVSTIYDSPLVARLRRACRPTPPSSPDPILRRKIDDSERDAVDPELGSALETTYPPTSEKHTGAFDKYMGTEWDKAAAARAKEFWSKTYEPANRGRQAHRPQFNYTSVMERDLERLKVKHKVDDQSSDTISRDSVCRGDVKRRRLDGGRSSGEERRAKGVFSRPGEHYWPAWRKYREMEDREHWEIFMGWKE